MQVRYYYYNRLHGNDYWTHQPPFVTVKGVSGKNWHLPDRSHPDFQRLGPAIIASAQKDGVTWGQLMTVDLTGWTVDPVSGQLNPPASYLDPVSGQRIYPPGSRPTKNWAAISAFETLRQVYESKIRPQIIATTGQCTMATTYALIGDLYGFRDPEFWIYEDDTNKVGNIIGMHDFSNEVFYSTGPIGWTLEQSIAELSQTSIDSWFT